MVTPEEIAKVLAGEVIKRDVLDGEDAVKAQARVKRFYGKAARKPREASKNGEAVSASEGDSVPDVEGTQECVEDASSPSCNP